MKSRLLLLMSVLTMHVALSADQGFSYEYQNPSDSYLDTCCQPECGNFLSDLFVNAAFTYWRADEEGLDIANSGELTRNGIGGFVISSSKNSKVLKQNFDYAPGFKLGIGSKICDNSVVLLEYTWFRNTTHQSHENNYSSYSAEDSVWIPNNWFIQTTDQGQSIAGSNLSSKWHLGLDLLDLSLGHRFCESSCYGISTFFGLRSAWIRQNIKVGINVPGELTGDMTSSTFVHSHNDSNSWGIGPRVGLNSYWLLGEGLRFEGDVAVSLLYTQYKLKHKEDVAAIYLNPSSLNTRYKNYNCLRPNLEMKLGLGWEKILCGYSVDFLVSYDFMIFWEQNMSRKLMDQTVNGGGAAASNLNVHGLTLNGLIRF